MERKKRIVTKIGNIFCVDVDNRYKCYFQYIANDWELLNSSTIRVFKKQYEFDTNPKMDEIVEDDVSFYAHTVLRAGIASGAWYKVGTSKKLGDTKNIMFRMHEDVNYYGTGKKKSFRWHIRRINERSQFVGEMNETYRKYDMDGVLSVINLITKIETGKYNTLYLD